MIGKLKSAPAKTCNLIMIYNMNGVEHGLGEGGGIKKIGALYFKNVKIYDPPSSLENLKRRNLILES